jgi:RimJ/RimL family protein N-acetyltransferase
MTPTDELREFAESPDKFVEVADDGLVTRFDDGRVCIVQGPSFASICAPKVSDDAVPQLLAEVRAKVPIEKRPTWWIGPSAQPPDIVERLLALGLSEPQDRTPLVHALAATAEPKGFRPGVEAHQVETFDDFAATAELRFEVFDVPEERRELERAHLPAYYEESQRIGIPVWFVARVDGRVAGSAGAIPSPRGVFLIGGSTASWARGRGLYTALVRARWDYAAARGTPALVTHAKPDSSYPILLHVGFQEICEIRRLEDRG